MKNIPKQNIQKLIINKNVMILPRFEKIALILILGFILNLIGGYVLSNKLILALYGGTTYEQYNLNLQIILFIQVLLKSVINIVLSIWIYKVAKKDKREPLKWACFAMFFGISAVILYFFSVFTEQIFLLNPNHNRSNIPLDEK